MGPKFNLLIIYFLLSKHISLQFKNCGNQNIPGKKKYPVTLDDILRMSQSLNV